MEGYNREGRSRLSPEVPESEICSTLLRSYLSLWHPLNICRFLSDTRPPHAFYVSKTPDTITALGSSDEQIRRLPLAMMLALACSAD